MLKTQRRSTLFPRTKFTDMFVFLLYYVDYILLYRVLLSTACFCLLSCPFSYSPVIHQLVSFCVFKSLFMPHMFCNPACVPPSFILVCTSFSFCVSLRFVFLHFPLSALHCLPLLHFWIMDFSFILILLLLVFRPFPVFEGV